MSPVSMNEAMWLYKHGLLRNELTDKQKQTNFKI